MKTQIENNGFIPGNGFLKYEEDDIPALVEELCNIAKNNCTLQDMMIADAMNKVLSTDEIIKEFKTYGVLGSIFYAGQIMGVRAERAKHTDDFKKSENI